MADITCEELKDRMDKGEKLNVIDVREPHEYEEFNIGAQLMPMNTVPTRLDELSPLKDQEIILHCRSGNRSGQVKMFLQDNGFSNVRNLLGGMLEWQSLYNGN
jgi:rhodanese-related sulfurtransferase